MAMRLEPQGAGTAYKWLRRTLTLPNKSASTVIQLTFAIPTLMTKRQNSSNEAKWGPMKSTHRQMRAI